MEEKIAKLEKTIAENNRLIADKIVSIEKTLQLAVKTIENISKSNMKLSEDIKSHERKIQEFGQFAEQVIKTNQQITTNIIQLSEQQKAIRDQKNED